MQQMERGASLSVRVSEERTKGLLVDDAQLSIAAINSPALCVVSGPLPSIEALEKRLEAESIAFSAAAHLARLPFADDGPHAGCLRGGSPQDKASSANDPLCLRRHRHMDHGCGGN